MQYFLRRRVLEDDMSKYACCQGYVNICGFKAGRCNEESCPTFCLCVESCLCNGCAVSASRMYVMDKFELSSDPCDYRLIRINNCIQAVACICDIVAIFDANMRHMARIADLAADIVYHTVSGCMTAQVIHELNFRLPNDEIHVYAEQTEPLVSSEDSTKNDKEPPAYQNYQSE
jgi:hypothetical protein